MQQFTQKILEIVNVVWTHLLLLFYTVGCTSSHQKVEGLAAVTPYRRLLILNPLHVLLTFKVAVKMKETDYKRIVYIFSLLRVMNCCNLS